MVKRRRKWVPAYKARRIARERTLVAVDRFGCIRQSVADAIRSLNLAASTSL